MSASEEHGKVEHVIDAKDINKKGFNVKRRPNPSRSGIQIPRGFINRFLGVAHKNSDGKVPRDESTFLPPGYFE